MLTYTRFKHALAFITKLSQACKMFIIIRLCLVQRKSILVIVGIIF